MLRIRRRGTINGYSKLIPLLIHTTAQNSPFPAIINQQVRHQHTISAEHIPKSDLLILNQSTNNNLKKPSLRPDITKLEGYRHTIRNSYAVNESKLRIQLEKFSLQRRKSMAGVGNSDENLEFWTSLTLHCLHLCAKDGRIGGFGLYCFQVIRETVDECLAGNQTNFNFKLGNKRLSEMASKLLMFYESGDKEHVSLLNRNYHSPQFQLLQDTLLIILPLLSPQPSIAFTTLQNYIQSITAGSIHGSCAAVASLPHFQSFVTRDILSRIPNSLYEVELLLNVYEDHLFGYKTPLPILKNLIGSVKAHKYSELSELITLIFKREKKLSNAELNDLLACVSEPLVSKTHDKDYQGMVLECHKVALSEGGRLHGKVNDVGYLSLALALIPFDVEKAVKCYQIGYQERSSNEMQRSLQIWFKECFPEGIRESLTNIDPRSVDDSVLINNRTSNDVSLGDLMHSASQEEMKITNQDLENLIESLYKAASSSETQEQYQELFKDFKDAFHYARYIYHHIASPSQQAPTAVTGKMLLGESQIDDSKEIMFDLYHYLLQNTPPNSKCISSLLQTAIKHPGLKWRCVDASKLAKLEFHKNIKLHKSDRTENKINASEALWTKYINIVALNTNTIERQTECQQILEYWEQLGYTPSKRNLGMLLAAMKFGEDLRERGVKFLMETHQLKEGWIWPDKYEAETWRNFIYKDH